MRWCILLSAILLFLGLRILRKLPTGGLSLPLLFALWLVGLAGALSHYYLLLLAGSVVGMLLLFTWNWSQRFALVLTGIAILVPVAAFISWHESLIVVDTQKTWFSVDAEFLMAHLYKGFFDIQKPNLRTVYMLGLLAAWAILLLKRPLAQKSIDDIFQICIFAIGCCLGPLLAAIVISFLTTPIFSFRVFFVAAPFTWLLMALVAGSVFKRLPPDPLLGYAGANPCRVHFNWRVEVPG